MSLKREEFLAFRKKAMEARKARLEEANNSRVQTVAHIVQALQSSSMVNGKD